MGINWGSTVGTEAAAARYNRDHLQRGGDEVFTYDENGAPEAQVIAPNAAGGRNNRELARQTTERKERRYVNGATGVSAVTGAKGAAFDELKAGPAPKVPGVA